MTTATGALVDGRSVTGHQVNGGIHGRLPSLTSLDGDKNLKTTVEFQHFYGNLLTTWLKADSAQILGRNYGDIGFLNAPGKPISGKKAPVAVSTTDRVARRAAIARLYLAFFGRLPDENGMAYWSPQLMSGAQTLNSISQSLAQSEQFRKQYGRLSNQQFVDLTYKNVLGRAADTNGRKHWAGVLDGGGGRGSVMVSFSESPEYIDQTRSAVLVESLYQGLLQRSPDPSGFAFWVDVAESGAPITDLIYGMLASDEYYNRFDNIVEALPELSRPEAPSRQYLTLD